MENIEQQTEDVKSVSFDSFDGIENPQTQQEQAKPEATTTQQDPPKQDDPPKQEEEVFDEGVYVKNNFGWDSAEAGKAELEELRKLKEAAKTPEEIKFANDESKRLFEAIKEGKFEDVYSLLHQRQTLSAVDNMKPEEVLKLHIKQTNKHFTQEDIDDVFEEKYAIPSKPVQDAGEDDDEFAARESEWNKQVAKIGRKIQRDSLEAKEVLSKLKTELVLPEIQKAADPNAEETKQKELQRVEAIRESYLKSLDTDYNKFTGFEVVYKDEEVELPLTFGVTDEERVKMKDEFKDFDVDGFFTTRWFNGDGSPNVKQQMEDIYLLRNRAAVMSKFANEAGKQRLEAFLKAKDNVTIKTTTTQKTYEPINEQGQKNLLDQVWS